MRGLRADKSRGARKGGRACMGGGGSKGREAEVLVMVRLKKNAGNARGAARACVDKRARVRAGECLGKVTGDYGMVVLMGDWLCRKCGRAGNGGMREGQRPMRGGVRVGPGRTAEHGARAMGGGHAGGVHARGEKQRCW